MKRPVRWIVGDAIDEFAHQYLSFGWVKAEGKSALYNHWYWRYSPFRILCNRREMSYGVETEQMDLPYQFGNTSTTSGINFIWTGWSYRRPSHDTSTR